MGSVHTAAFAMHPRFAQVSLLPESCSWKQPKTTTLQEVLSGVSRSKSFVRGYKAFLSSNCFHGVAHENIEHG